MKTLLALALFCVSALPGVAADLVNTNPFPYLVLTGDSIVAPDQFGLTNILCYPTGVTTTNMGTNGGSMAEMLLQTNYINAARPYAIILHIGVNDVNGGFTWKTGVNKLEPLFNQFRVCVTAGGQLFVDEILPWSQGSDVRAATIRDINAELVYWCATNRAVLIRCHDPIAVTRPTTGYLDDMNPSYGGGLHLDNQDGKNVLRDLWCAALLPPGKRLTGTMRISKGKL